MAAQIIAVQDPQDPRVAVFRNVMDKDLRAGHGGLFMAESEMVLRQLARTPARLHSLLILEARLPRLRDVLEDLPEGLPAYVVPRPVAEAVARCRAAAARIGRPWWARAGSSRASLRGPD